MIDLNPFEYTILSFFRVNGGRKFTHVEIAKHCKINIRTARVYCQRLYNRNLIKRELLRNEKKVVFFYKEA